MAVEHYIIGKRDSAKHDGLYSNRKREQAAQAELDTGLERYYEEIVETTDNQTSSLGNRQQRESLPPPSMDKRQPRNRR